MFVPLPPKTKGAGLALLPAPFPKPVCVWPKEFACTVAGEAPRLPAGLGIENVKPPGAL